SNVVMGGDSGGAEAGLVSSGYVARLDPTGAPDERFGEHGIVRELGDSVLDLLTDTRNRVYALGTSQLSRFNVDGTQDASFSSGADVRLLNGAGSGWSSMQFADATRSSVYLMGGAGCVTSCAGMNTSAVIANVILFTDLTGSADTTTTLNASATTISGGDTVTFTAFVSGAEPTGSVTFKDGSAVLATEALAAAGTRYSTSALAVGEHSITAVYSGDDHNAASYSRVVTESVLAGPPGGVGAGGTGGGGGRLAELELGGMRPLWVWRSRGAPNPSKHV